MLRITLSNSASGAVKYFDEGLTKADYYQDKEHTVGRWNGKGKELLGLDSEVSRKDFVSLAYNQNPLTGEQLTPRMNENRRVGYDFTFNAPKSISILHSLTDDPEILKAFNNSISKTMLEIEKAAETRVRINGANENRITGNLLWANFTHEEARPVNGIPDPSIHQHVFIFNSTYDSVEGRWKAADISEIKSSAPYYEAMFHNHLANEMTKAGYEIERNNYNFEVKGFDKKLIEKFSNRTRQVEEKAKELGLVTAAEKSELASRNRESKRKGFDPKELLMQWKSRLSEREKEIVYGAKNADDSIIGRVKNIWNEKDKTHDKSHHFYSADESIDLAISHHLERKSVTTEKEILRKAYKLGSGAASVNEINKALKSREDLLRGEDSFGRSVITTQEALNEEQTLIKSARKGKGRFEAINPSYEPKNKKLTDEQKHGVNHFLSSKDSITIISGGAGVGKTWSIKEVRDAVKEQGLAFKAFAPSSIASRQVQQEEGFEGATTIAELLTNKKMQNSVADGVIWVDESGLVGTKTMNKLVDLAEKQNARILLTGDIKQHNAVERGDAQRIIQKFGGIEPAYIKTIKRQQTKDYRSVVKDISEGDILKGYNKLDEIGAIKEHEDFAKLRESVAVEYAEALKKKEDTLLVATTHALGKAVTVAVRDKLKQENILKGKEKNFSIHENIGLTETQKQDAVNYQEGMAVQFNFKRKGGVLRGSKYDVVKSENGIVHLKNLKGQEHILDLSEPKMFSVYEKRKINVAVGDKLRITRNGVSEEGKRLDNGTTLTVSAFDRKGNIRVKTSGKRELVLAKDFGNFTHGYYNTSIAAQGKSVNKVIIAQDSLSGKATSKEQFYVSTSRGKFSISIHTDDKQALLRNIQRSSQRQTATEIANQNKFTSKNKAKLQRIGQIYKTAKNTASTLGMAIKNKMNPPVKTPTHGRKGR